jgi:all-beta uncharacterized protein
MRKRVAAWWLALVLAAAAACGRGATEPAGLCGSLRLSVAGAPVGSTGGTGTITVTAPASCTWTAGSSVSWLSLSASSGTGTAVIPFTAYPNPTTESRTATVTVGAAAATVRQDPLVPDNCAADAYTITPSARSAPAGGAAFVVLVRAPADCAWATSTAAAWLSLSDPGPGLDSRSFFAWRGTGEVFVEVAANPGADVRTATAAIGRQTLTVTQDGTARTACSYAIAPASANFSAAGGLGTFTVTTSAVCSWALDVTASGEDFVRWSGSRFGSGTQTVTYTVKANDWGAPRSGTLAVYGDSGVTQRPIALFTVHQSDR